MVDGSNLATEGRTTPSLRQLDEAVRAYLEEDPEAEVVVVVDASFEHRIDPSERERLEDAALHGEVVSPPAGAIGRGDAFVLRIAERTGARVLSNDSFQEFHAEHPWLFDEGRLVGGKPVPGVGWIFTPRLPVRGARSRQAVAKAAREAEDELSATKKAAELAKAARSAAPKKTAGRNDAAEPKGSDAQRPVMAEKKAAAATKPTRSKKAPEPERATEPTKTTKSKKAPELKTAAPEKKGTKSKKSLASGTPSPGAPSSATPSPRGARPARGQEVERAIGDALAEAAGETKAPERRARSKSSGKGVDQESGRVGPEGSTRRRGTPPPAVNAPLSFIRFVAAHPLESEVEGEVVSFTSHGAMVDVRLPDGEALHCYIPLTAMGDPAPLRAREVLKRGERRSFVLSGLDPPRRVAELALPVSAQRDGVRRSTARPAGAERRTAPERPTTKTTRRGGGRLREGSAK